MPKYIGRIWVDVEIVAKSLEEAREVAKSVTNNIGFEKTPVDAEIYDVQFERFFTEDGQPIVRGR